MQKVFTTFLVAGQGVIGLEVAKELARRNCGHVTAIEKENRLGAHASGRSSCVVHAGLYYASDSLKARFCQGGARYWQEYTRRKGIAYCRTGKVVVAQSPDSVERLEALFKRAEENGINVAKVSAEGLKRVEPEARTHEFAINSPDTAIADAYGILAALHDDLHQLGVNLRFNQEVIGVDPAAKIARTRDLEIHYKHFINCAGLHADRVAKFFGAGSKYRVMPFRGSYMRLSLGAASRIGGSIYPTPNPGLPFLGVHLTRVISGEVTIGPSAFPAFGREHYEGVRGIEVLETPVILWRLFRMLAMNASGVRSHAIAELRSKLASVYLREVQTLAPFVQRHDILPHVKVGIRPQLVRADTLELVMDFVVEDGPSSTHVLNTISPGFTCANPFARYIVKRALA